MLSRQRQHFARVRAQLQAGSPSAVPFTPDFLCAGNELLGTRKPIVESREAHHTRRSQNCTKYGAKLDSDVTFEKFTLAADANRDTDLYRGRGHDPKAKSLSQPLHSHSCTWRSSRLLSKHGQPHDPHGRLTEQKPQAHNTLTMHVAADDDFDKERRRLLQQSDWVGVAASRPVLTKFRSTQEKDKVGKRRRVAKTTARRQGLGLGDSIRPPAPPLQPLHADDENISIRIGADVLRMRSPEWRQVQPPPVDNAEDVLLLDPEEEIPDAAKQQACSMARRCAAHRANSCQQESDISQRGIETASSPVAANPGDASLEHPTPEDNGDYASIQVAEPWMAECELETDRGVLPPLRLNFESSTTHDPDAHEDDHLCHRPRVTKCNHVHAANRKACHFQSSPALLSQVNVALHMETNAHWREILALPPQQSASLRNSHTGSEQDSVISVTMSELLRSAEPLEDGATRSIVEGWSTRANDDQTNADIGTSPSMVKVPTGLNPLNLVQQVKESAELRPNTPVLTVAGATDGDDVWRKFVFSDESDIDLNGGSENEDGNLARTDAATQGKSNISPSPAAPVYDRAFLSSWSRGDMLQSTLDVPDSDHARNAEEDDFVSISSPAAGKEDEHRRVLVSDSMFNHASPFHAPKGQPQTLLEDGSSCSKPGRPTQKDTWTSPPLQVLSSFRRSFEHSAGNLGRLSRNIFCKPQAFVGSRTGTGRDGPRGTSASTSRPNSKVGKTKRTANISIFDIPVSDQCGENIDDIED